MIKNFCIIIFSVFFLFSCSKKQDNIAEELSFVSSDGKEVKLQKVSFSDFKSWKKENFDDFIKAFSLSCNQILKEKKEFLGDTVIKIPTIQYQNICKNFFDEKIKNNDSFKTFVEDNFIPYSISENGIYDGRITAYYNATINVSKQKSDIYKYPIYAKPEDLVFANLQKFDSSFPKERLVGRVENGEFIPYYTRAEIEQNIADTKKFPVLLWADNLVDVFIMQIQGSAIAVLPDGSFVSINYIENNGKQFRGIGAMLLEDKKVESGKASMSEVKKWLKAHPEEGLKYMQRNERFVFFKISDTKGAIGAQGIELTPQRSIAVDRTKIPLGTMLWLETSYPDKKPLEKLVIAQDVGKAIVGTIRGDFFWGYGETALENAGKMSSSGRYYILMPKNND